MMTRSEFLAVFGATLVSAGTANAQVRPRPDLYACEGCEAAGERAADALPWRTVIAGPDEPGERMILSGVARNPDGAPAADVVVYAHHTNAEGLYADGSSDTEWSRRHGRLRAWVKTGADGRYEFDTIKPAPYPSRDMPAHVHLFVLEPGRPPYWIDDVVFDGEFRVDDAYRRRAENRGGGGIVTLAQDNGVWIAQRDIVLEIHPD